MGTEARCRVGGAGCEHEGRVARDKQEALVEVLVWMHGGRRATHVGVNGDNRTSTRRTGCPGCASTHKVPTDQNNLLKWCQDNGEWGQKLIEEWAEPDVNMKDVTFGTNKKLLWRCSAGCTVDGEPFTWEATGNNRTSPKHLGALAARQCADRPEETPRESSAMKHSHRSIRSHHVA